MTITHVDPELKTYATERQAQYIDLVNKHGSAKAAELAEGMSNGVISAALQRVRESAARRGYAPEAGLVKPIPALQKLRGMSKLTDLRTGEDMLLWTKTSADDVALEEAMRAAFEAMAQELPRSKPVPLSPIQFSQHLLNVYTLTDCHVGMLAWAKETGEPWDLKIAEETLLGCFEQMIRSSPRARVAYVNQLGDFLHTDGMKSITPEHGHLLDSDGRFPKMAATATRILRKVIAIALEHHEQVVVLAAEGNHDPAASIWLRVMLAALYENEPRVEVVESAYPYYAHQHGLTMVAFHHGHLKKPEGLPLHFAATFPKVWGATTRRYAHCGHRHHSDEKEHSGMTVFQHPTLSAKDAYAARGGWDAKRSATAVTYHDKFGEVGRITVCPEMLEEAV